ncbi:MAG: hypothetical protein KC776_34975 [Myxococcales bacterium]|nr:hypothetical protein [Myxococcales bacterium]MCB9576381.1 hypothetical protein [Polyangiaceae bacterium]
MAKTEEKLDAALVKASAEDALTALDSAGSAAVALVDAWVQAKNTAAVMAAAEGASGPVRKAARRGLSVLKSRGVAVGEPKKEKPAAPKSEEIVEAYMLAPDTAGSLLFVVATRSVAKRSRSAFVFLNDEVGIHRVDVGEMSQSGLKDAMAKVLPGAQYKPVKVPVEWARYRIAEARKHHAEGGAPEPLGLTSAQALITPVPDKAPVHPFDDEGLELSDEDASEMGAGSTKLHGYPEFRGWFPTRAAVDEMMMKLGETITPGKEPDQEALKELLEKEIDAATDRYFSPQRRAGLTRAMRDSALSILAREGEQAALEVVAAIKCIDRCGLITDPPHEVGFLRGYFEKAVSLMLTQNAGSLRIPVMRPPAAPEATDAEPAPVVDASDSA